jgi:4-aminobutyrate aminotransferase-like enzyme
MKGEMLSTDLSSMIERRNRLLGPAYRLFYPKSPIHAVSAQGVWITDADGRKYLDTYNNVPHIGHCHPRVVEAVSEHVATFNSHTRYLHDTVLDYAEKLLATFESELDTVHFGCSGTEANEIALRLARFHTGNRGVIVMECAYHGHSQSIYEISSRDVPADQLPDYVATVPTPDPSRGIHTGEDAADRYLEYVQAAIQDLEERGYGVAAFIVDTVQSAGGTIIPPEGYYKRAADLVRQAGGLFIADEVQAGFARMGSVYWPYQAHGVVPDFVTLGKPMGNGMPLAGCVSRREYVEKFARSNKYFNTFAAIPVTCAAGMAVLEVLEDENLQAHAWKVGEYLKAGLNDLADRHNCIGDIRGSGFFIGLDLVTDRDSMNPATEFADRVIYGLKDRSVFSGAIGPHMNTLKIRPPMIFTGQDAEFLLQALDDTLCAIA